MWLKTFFSWLRTHVECTKDKNRWQSWERLFPVRSFQNANGRPFLQHKECPCGCHILTRIVTSSFARASLSYSHSSAYTIDTFSSRFSQVSLRRHPQPHLELLPWQHCSAGQSGQSVPFAVSLSLTSQQVAIQGHHNSIQPMCVIRKLKDNENQITIWSSSGLCLQTTTDFHWDGPDNCCSENQKDVLASAGFVSSSIWKRTK